jgi:hypothetical protein
LPLASTGLSPLGGFGVFGVSCLPDEPAGDFESDVFESGVFESDAFESDVPADFDSPFLVSRGGSSSLFPPIPTGTSSAFRLSFGACVPGGK